jgi:hypothetical protein
MYGDLLNGNSRLIPQEEYSSILPGTPIVINFPQSKYYVHFAIFLDENTVVYQCCFEPKKDSFPFQIRSESLYDLLNDGRNG